ncbi:Phospholipid-transporting ATPase [Fusarium falciforme]|uniref:Phospholipid-transporting ATPase n=1 Tax=Fusarium falciforme TaxID=195108 RepID=UPI00230088EF|nr:Phospholipid-transporting ATPase [Fusarium falciforme]KAJ4201808.1 putative aminophospholipid-translocase [Fusarium falciforme]KAJ4250688.1 putative aminophospholipid-translocase [Fusarium falciforme]WAO94063.1 Phospholipid-transporting ATPase [Fusarium falciforme]
MTPSPSYRSSDPPDSPAHDSDSDLELDIQELDPISTSPAPRANHERLSAEPQTSRIALRNLRMGGLRRASKRNRGYGDLGQDRDGADEHSQALLGGEQDGNGPRWSEGSGYGEDDRPLLGDQASQSRRSMNSDRVTSRLRLPSFMSGSKKPEPNDADDQEDDDPSASRHVAVGSTQPVRFPNNIISNAKYTALTFLPITLYNEFSFFFNMYFLLVALSQAIPALRIGYLLTYIAPLAFVLCITMGKEAFDDIARRRRDTEANSEEYNILVFQDSDSTQTPLRQRKMLKSELLRKQSKRPKGARDSLSDILEEDDSQAPPPSSRVVEVSRKSKDLKVGDVLKLTKGQRVPADVVILKCFSSEAPTPAPIPEEPAEEESLLAFGDGEADPAGKGKQPAEDTPEEEESGPGGETFIRTDQLDGETDWKLRLASPLTQNLPTEEFVRLRVTGGKPDRKVNEFLGTIELLDSRKDALAHHAMAQDSDASRTAALSIDNTAWANTVIASQATTLAVIMYTGPQTRSALSTAPSRSKTGLLEYEINSLTKILCALTLALSIILVALEGFGTTEGNVWYVKIMRFLVLFSTIVPISLRVNLDMGKSAYSWFIQRDPGMPGAVVRTSTIPEDLGRIEYLLSDKTGTLTQNEMEMKKIHVGTVSYANEAMDEVSTYVRQGFYIPPSTDHASNNMLITPSSTYSSTATMGTTRTRREIGTRVRDVVLALALCHNVTPTVDIEDGKEVTGYQASSPDEIAIVKWTESVGLRLVYRDRKSMVLEFTGSKRPVVRVRILDVFPFTSEGKRMGIIVHFHENVNVKNPDLSSGEIWFFQKGADTVMSSIVAANDWLDEETANMAREGLRTLVVGRKKLSSQQYQEFSSRYQEASLSISGRDAGMQRVVSHYLERDLELIGVTGVEDKLQKDVKPSLELLRNAGIKIWMLTGDKVETARCVAVSSKLVARGQYIYTVAKLKKKDNAQEHLDFLRSKTDACLLIDGESLALFLTHFRIEFISIAVQLPTVVACRCSPNQKAEVAKLIREYTKKRVCCIGDGGNDVSMIQAADVGVGIVGKEGRQASLAADFSIEQFCHLVKLLVWHGRNSYKRSAKLAQFVIHRGLIIAVCQTMYSIAIKFEPEGLYKDWLLVGYATVYTAAPVLSLVLDKDVDENLANLYPELYKELTSGRSLSYRTFFVWVFVSIYQGGMIQGLSQILTEVDGPKMVAVSYTVLVLNELLMVAIEITTWHPIMIISIVGTFLLYIGSIPFLGGYFDLKFLITLGFVWRVLAIGAISLIPPYAGKLIRRTMKPPSYRKVQSH